MGAQVEARRGWQSPGIRTTQSVSVDKASAVDADGAPVRITKCEDRFIGALERNATWEQARIDLVDLRVGLSRRDTSSAMVGWLASASLDVRRGAKPGLNFALGPAPFPPNYPDVVLGALLVEELDAWNGSGQVAEFSDRVAVRLYVGVPFRF